LVPSNGIVRAPFVYLLDAIAQTAAGIEQRPNAAADAVADRISHARLIIY
jgi:hypothetical protein